MALRRDDSRDESPCKRPRGRKVRLDRRASKSSGRRRRTPSKRRQVPPREASRGSMGRPSLSMRSLRDLVLRPAPPVRVIPGRVAVVIPAFNECGKIGAVVRKVPRRSAGCVIVVDDASADATSDEARAAGADRVLRHPVNRGVGAAIRSGLFEARAAGFEFAVILSGDDQHEPDELPRVLEPLFAGEADLVQGSRWLPGGATPGIPSDRRWLTRLYPWLFRLASG